MARAKKERPSVAEIENQRDRVLKLASLQTRLRKLLREHQESLGDSINALKHVFGGKVPSFIYRFLEGKRAICSGDLLEAITGELGCYSLSEKIVATSNTLNDRLRGLSSFPEDIINLVFDLKIALTTSPTDINSKSFAACFTPHQKTVAGALAASRDQIQKLELLKVNRVVRDLLEDDKWRERIAKKDLILQKASRLKSIVDRLLETLNTLKEIARLLDVSPSTLHGAFKGEASEDMIEKLIQKGEKLLDRFAGNQGSSIEHGGETSPLGVRYVLGPDSFREIEFDPSEESVQFARRSLVVVRAVLNIFSQIKEEKVRIAVMRELSPEVEELELAIRLFTTRYPNRLTGLHDAQRKTWARDGKKRTRTRGGR